MAELPNWIQFTDSDDVLFSTAATAKLFKTSAKTLAQWAKQGAPKEKTGWWNLEKLLEWRGQSVGKTTDGLSDEARKLKADAEFKEIKARKEQIALDLLEGRLIEREEVDRIWTSVGIQIKNNLLMWSKSLTPHLAHQDMRNVEAALNQAVYDLLDQLSSKGKFSPKKTKYK